MQTSKLVHKRRVLVIGHPFLGDALMTSPMITALLERGPQMLAILASGTGLEVYRRLPGAPLVLDREDPGMLRRLKEYHFELAFVLKDDLASAILAWRCRINQRRGFAREGASLFLTHAIDPKKTSRHGAARHFALAAMTAPKNPQTSFLVSADEAQEAKTLLGQTKTYIVFTPTTTRTEKDWPETACRDFIEKCTSLSPSTKPMTIVLLGVAGDSDRHQRIAAGTPVLNLTGKTSVGVMAALIQSATCLVACDSGPMHLAAALKRPLVALFGQTDPDHCGPASPFATIIRAETTCAPCHNRHCGANSACMASITAEKVYAAVAQILGGRDKV